MSNEQRTRNKLSTNILIWVAVLAVVIGVPVGFAVKGKIDENNERDRQTDEVSRVLSCGLNPDLPGCD